MSEFEELIGTLPLDRVGVLIGRDGSFKRRIENLFGVKLKINSETGEVHVILSEDVLNDYLKRENLKNIITAISLGFSGKDALKLLDDDFFIDSIDIRRYARNEKDIERLKGRVIGKRGKAWKFIEQLTGVRMAVHGYYVSFIGSISSCEIAKTAVRMLLEGKQHNTVYHYLESVRRELKEKELELWGNP
ncbi:RNA-processing protein [Thermococci archaeon]|nr:MAG: RNA-processing protein [Thermococci archaeon]